MNLCVIVRSCAWIKRTVCRCRLSEQCARFVILVCVPCRIHKDLHSVMFKGPTGLPTITRAACKPEISKVVVASQGDRMDMINNIGPTGFTINTTVAIPDHEFWT